MKRIRTNNLINSDFLDLLLNTSRRRNTIINRNNLSRIMHLISRIRQLRRISSISTITLNRSRLLRLQIPAANLITRIRTDLRRVTRDSLDRNVAAFRYQFLPNRTRLHTTTPPISQIIRPASADHHRRSTGLLYTN